MDIAGHLHGVPGLFVAAVYSSSLSTVSSGINAMACVVLEDFIRPVSDWRELTYTRTSRLLVLLFGLSYIAIAYLASEVGGLIRMAYSIHGILGGPIVAVFIVGILSTWINEWGALSGLFAGVSATVWLYVGKILYPSPMEYRRKLPTFTDGCEENPQPVTTTLFNTSEDFVTSYDFNASTTTVYSNLSNFSTPVTSESVPTMADRPIIAEFYSISYLHAATLGFFTTVLISMIVSIFTGRNKTRPANELLVPYLRKSDDSKVQEDKSLPKTDGVERSASWFRPERYSVHQKDMDDVILQLTARTSTHEPLLSPGNAHDDFPAEVS